MSISTTLRQAIDEFGWTVDALAERVGIPADTLQNLLMDGSPFEVADRLTEVVGLQCVSEIDFDEFVAQNWPDYVKEAWAEYEKNAWAAAQQSGWDNYELWRESVYASWEIKTRAMWKQGERERLESLPWVSIIGDD
jgi:hypothetical protein